MTSTAGLVAPPLPRYRGRDSSPTHIILLPVVYAMAFADGFGVRTAYTYAPGVLPIHETT